MRLILLLLCALLIAGCDRQRTDNRQDNAPQAVAGPVKGVDRSHKGESAPDVAFVEPDAGGEMTLESFRGTPVLVNLWATWCAPCVKELPTLNALARQRMADLAVAPISQDMGPQGSVEAFLGKLKVDQLGAYHDPKMALSAALGAEVLPTSILYDADGREVWRYVGDLDWTGEEAARLLAEAEPRKGS